MSAVDTAQRAALRVLLVEDDEEDAFLVQDQLEELGVGASVVHVRTLREALPLAADADCAVVDLGLPDAMGLEAVERLAEGAPDTALVVLTGLHDAQRGLDALGAGAQDYLTKGEVDGAALWRAVRYAVERRRSERTQRELTLANQLAAENRRLERGLLPRPLTLHPRLVLGSSYRAGRKRALLGGDFFDAIEDEDGTLHLVIGDVSGHGPDEAALGVALRITWRALVLAGVRGADLLRGMEDILRHERHEPDIFATVCSVTAWPSEGRAAVQLAGHPGPVLLTAATSPARLPSAPGLPLGVLPERAAAATEIELPEHWGLLLHTDGLLEGVVDGGERLGDERLLALIGEQLAADPAWGAEPQRLADTLIAAAEQRFAAPSLDDSAVLIAAWTP